MADVTELMFEVLKSVQARLVQVEADPRDDAEHDGRNEVVVHADVGGDQQCQ